MVAVNPPYAMQDSPTDHPAVLFRRMLGGVFTNGIARLNGANDLQVIGSTPATRSVTVRRGGAYVQGSHGGGSDQGLYFVYNDGDVVVPLDAVGNGMQRVDTIVARVYDGEYGDTGGTVNTWRLEPVLGTEVASGAVAPAILPVTSYPLANVVVSGSITNSGITDRRTYPTVPSLGTGTVVTATLADLAVTSGKLADAAATSRKFAPTILHKQNPADYTATTIYADVPNFSHVFTPPVTGMYALVFVNVIFSGGSSSTRGVQARITNNGIVVGAPNFGRADVSNYGDTLTLVQLVGPLTTAQHTIQVQVGKVATGGTVIVATNSTLTALLTGGNPAL